MAESTEVPCDPNTPTAEDLYHKVSALIEQHGPQRTLDEWRKFKARCLAGHLPAEWWLAARDTLFDAIDEKLRSQAPPLVAKPAEAVTGVQQGPKITYTALNHQYVQGRAKNGYAYCVNCGATEQDDAIVQPCLKGPLAHMERRRDIRGDRDLAHELDNFMCRLKWVRGSKWTSLQKRLYAALNDVVEAERMDHDQHSYARPPKVSNTDIRHRVAEVLGDSRMQAPSANVLANAFRTLIRVEGSAAVAALKWVLGERSSCADSFPHEDPDPTAHRPLAARTGFGKASVRGESEASVNLDKGEDGTRSVDP